MRSASTFDRSLRLVLPNHPRSAPSATYMRRLLRIIFKLSSDERLMLLEAAEQLSHRRRPEPTPDLQIVHRS